MSRRKALVAAANGPHTGPWIYLEAGEWIVELPASGGFELETENSEIEVQDNVLAKVRGPDRVRIKVPAGEKNLFVHAVQLSRA